MQHIFEKQPPNLSRFFLNCTPAGLCLQDKAEEKRDIFPIPRFYDRMYNEIREL
ncbi:hypothetical protein HMPREF0262_03730 [Clostridium sp. ATCC 29733]|nr:hypothetical protein HMPREF0262_03730 [Clostridium sp. ATCC 29733]